MAKTKAIPAYAVAYFMWIVSFSLFVIFIFVSRDAIVQNMAVHYYQNNFTRGKQIQFVAQAWPVFTGIIWLILMIVVEEYFRNGVKKGDLAKRIGRVMGPEILLIFAANLLLAVGFGLGTLPATGWLLLLVELAFGLGFIWLARNGLVQTKKPNFG